MINTEKPPIDVQFLEIRQTTPSSSTKYINFNSYQDANKIPVKKLTAIDLTHFRNSSLPLHFYLFLALPIVGWIALACLKINYVIKNMQAERLMKESQYHLLKTNEEKIKVLKDVIKKSGPLAWQYQLELCRLQLLNGDHEGADVTLNEINKQRETPVQTGWYNVRDKELVSFKVAKGNWVDGKNVIAITHYTAEEAMINASVHTINGRFVAAYDSYNQAIYYNESVREEVRPYQVALVKEMQESKSTLTCRALEIIEAEIAFTARQTRAREGEIGRL